MSDVDVKISIEVLDAAAKRALGGISDQADKLGKTTQKAGDQASTAVRKLGKEGETTFEVFLKGVGQATGGFGGLGSSITGVAGLLTGPLGLAIGAATAAFFGLRESFNLIKEAEQIKTINAQFDALAENAGVAGGALRTAFEGAADGLVDDDEIIRSANKALLELDEFATDLPKVFELARKTSQQFGGEITENFDRLSAAIASGNTRSLKAIGIFVDSERAVKQYAAALGVASNDLTETGRRQALLNAVLEKGEQTFSTVDQANLKTTNELKRLGVAFDEAKEAGAQFFERVLGGVANSAVKGTSGVLTSFTDLFVKAFGTEQEKAQVKVRETERTVQSLHKQLADQEAWIKNAEGAGRSAQVLEFARGNAQKLREEIGRLSSAQEESDMRAMKRAQSTIKTDEDKTRFVKELTEAQKAQIEAERQARESAAANLVKEAESPQAKFSRDLEILQAQKDAELIVEEEFFARKQQLATDKFLEEQAAIDELRKNNAFKSEQDYYAARDNLASNFAAGQARRDAERVISEKKAQKAITDEEDKKLKEREQNMRGSLGYISTLQQSSVKELFVIGKAAALATAYIDGQAATMKALSAAPPPFNYALAAAVGIAAAANIARIASAKPPAFEDGGIVPGSSYTGDRVMARVNSGEMVLNKGQQAQLFRMANGEGGGNAQLLAEVRQLSGAVMALASQPVTVQVEGREIFRATRNQLNGGRSF